MFFLFFPPPRKACKGMNDVLVFLQSLEHPDKLEVGSQASDFSCLCVCYAVLRRIMAAVGPFSAARQAGSLQGNVGWYAFHVLASSAKGCFKDRTWRFGR